VGSIGIQLVKTLTDGQLYATTGREDSYRWLEQLGVDGLVDRRRPLVERAKGLGIDGFDAVFSTTHTNEYFAQLADVVRPFGSIVAIDRPGPARSRAPQAARAAVRLGVDVHEIALRVPDGDAGEDPRSHRGARRRGPMLDARAVQRTAHQVI